MAKILTCKIGDLTYSIVISLTSLSMFSVVISLTTLNMLSGVVHTFCLQFLFSLCCNFCYFVLCSHGRIGRMRTVFLLISWLVCRRFVLWLWDCYWPQDEREALRGEMLRAGFPAQRLGQWEWNR